MSRSFYRVHIAKSEAETVWRLIQPLMDGWLGSSDGKRIRVEPLMIACYLQGWDDCRNNLHRVAATFEGGEGI